MSSEKLEREAFKKNHSPCNQVCVGGNPKNIVSGGRIQEKEEQAGSLGCLERRKEDKCMCLDSVTVKGPWRHTKMAVDCLSLKLQM